MPNAFEEIDWIAAEALSVMSDNLIIAPLVSMDKSSDWNTVPDGYAKGDTIRIKTGPDYEAKEFAGSISIQSVRSSSRNMKIEKHFDISVELTSKEMALDFEGFINEVIAPSAIRLAEKVEIYTASKILDAHGLYHSAVLLETSADVALARQAALLQQLNPGNRFCLVDDTLEAKLLGKDWFNQSQTRGADGETTLRTGQMGSVMGMDFFSSVNFPSTDAAASGTYSSGTGVTNNGAGNLVGEKTLITTAVVGGLTAGDHLKIAGVKRPIVVASNVAALATSIPLVDPITEIIPDATAISVIGSGLAYVKRGAIFDDKSLAVAFPILDLPGDQVASVLSAGGVSIRVVRGYNMTDKKTTMSMDVLVGAACYEPRRITLLSDDV
ncbi:MAG: hypothetical protein JKY33_10615 [Bacteroidia bacterium]|nr:hypothetical protein [Bacteroidia bacterium]